MTPNKKITTDPKLVNKKIKEKLTVLEEKIGPLTLEIIVKKGLPKGFQSNEQFIGAVIHSYLLCGGMDEEELNLFLEKRKNGGCDEAFDIVFSKFLKLVETEMLDFLRELVLIDVENRYYDSKKISELLKDENLDLFRGENFYESPQETDHIFQLLRVTQVLLKEEIEKRKGFNGETYDQNVLTLLSKELDIKAEDIREILKPSIYNQIPSNSDSVLFDNLPLSLMEFRLQNINSHLQVMRNR